MEKSGVELINDNSKRSVSIRINTSDFGRVKAISRRLKIRESDVFRFLLKVGLAEVSALCRGNASPQELLGVFAAHGAELVRHFDLNAQRLAQIINLDPRDNGVRVEAEDLELIAISAFPERYLALRMQELMGTPLTAESALPALRAYLEAKYLSPRPSIDQVD
jgi:hypothetical protein